MPPKAKANLAQEDTKMEEAPANGSPGADGALVDFSENRIKILDGSSETAASFQFAKEDHTLGNALRYIIMKNPDVEFCGYSIPHPSEELMNIRIQTYPGTSAVEALDKGFKDLMDLCDVVATTFMEAREEYDNTMEQ